MLAGSYIGLVFTEAALNDRPENLLLLASQLIWAIDNRKKWSAGLTRIAGTYPFGQEVRLPIRVGNEAAQDAAMSACRHARA